MFVKNRHTSLHWIPIVFCRQIYYKKPKSTRISQALSIKNVCGFFFDNELYLSADHTTNFIEPGPPPLEEANFEIDDFSGEGPLVFEQRVLDVINSQCGLSCGTPDNLATEGGTQMVPIYQDCWDTTDLDRRYPNGSEWKKDDCQTCTCLVCFVMIW